MERKAGAHIIVALIITPVVVGVKKKKGKGDDDHVWL